MDNPDACLFVCNICFNDNEEKMVTCANNYCLSPDMYTGLPYLLIGKRCEHWENLNKYVLSELKH
ncbi:hypothetical protein FSP39_015920 [Pinctada imbricata]|uniref:Uncharacterized protein n=1 Tax=Pinctada imbricata TaxID=66713 RepID=A0AA88Y3N4_PINIB|nr:hypothetical protein FSP39_015920 [Pinctada imbricata]